LPPTLLFLPPTLLFLPPTLLFLPPTLLFLPPTLIFPHPLSSVTSIDPSRLDSWDLHQMCISV
ncbi:unnamed protein product, partial [Mesocestoides corti]|uniref:Ovule protein n=1 Tax=Mesocestoides corti TaxID=53468 RepID=A0A0R3UCZ7_MESCO